MTLGSEYSQTSIKQGRQTHKQKENPADAFLWKFDIKDPLTLEL